MTLVSTGTGTISSWTFSSGTSSTGTSWDSTGPYLILLLAPWSFWAGACGGYGFSASICTRSSSRGTKAWYRERPWPFDTWQWRLGAQESRRPLEWQSKLSTMFSAANLTRLYQMFRLHWYLHSRRLRIKLHRCYGSLRPQKRLYDSTVSFSSTASWFRLWLHFCSMR